MPQKTVNTMSFWMKIAQDLVQKDIFAMTFPVKHGNTIILMAQGE